MRHGISGNRLNRNSSLRKATIRDLAKAILIQQRVQTTKAKAKEARKMVEHLITLGKKGTLDGRRRAFAILCDHQLVSDLFNNTAPLFKNRVGGYTRIIPLGVKRSGDNAQLALLELTEKRAPKEPVAKAVETKKVKEPKPAAATPPAPEAKTPKAQPQKAPDQKQAAPEKKLGGFRSLFQKKSEDKKKSDDK